MTDVTTFRTEGLGDSTYLLVHAGLAVLVDPQRDIDRFLEVLEETGAELRWVVETHIHNDYVSGGLAAATKTGAELVMPAAAAPVFRHIPAFHAEKLSHGPLTLMPLHTPGHTPEHTSYLVEVEGEHGALFSGGSLLVGSAGRSDLLGTPRAASLARLQYRSIGRLAGLPDDTGLYPTHGAGSFCTASGAGSHTSTIGAERRTSPVLSHRDEESFVTAHLGNLQPYPTYYSRMAPINLAGPPGMPPLTAAEADIGSVGPTDEVVDLRPADEFVAGHHEGSLNIPLASEFGTWFGWIIPAGATTYLVSSSPADTTEALIQLARVGVDEVAGVITPPVPMSGVQGRIGTVSDVPADAQILDVRSPGERADLAPAGSVHRYLPDLVAGVPSAVDASRPVWVMCGGGYRAAIGASILQSRGYEPVAVTKGGVADLQA
ncbi:MBL fold metallo-hydrolase [soil metagenome]